MASLKLTAEQVKESRRRAWLGEPIKAIARDINRGYGTVWNAVRGRTWSSIFEPAPVPNGYKAVFYRRCINGNCSELYTGRPNNGLCPACYVYLTRHGEYRIPENMRSSRYIDIPEEELGELCHQYLDGASLEVLAAGKPYSAETIRRRFVKSGFVRRNNAGTRMQLCAEWVEQARYRVHYGGERVCDVAEEAGVNYATAFSAIMGQTWRGAGGPLPEKARQAKNKCRRCGLLTEWDYCRLCRREGRGSEELGDLEVTAVTLSFDLKIE